MHNYLSENSTLLTPLRGVSLVVLVLDNHLVLRVTNEGVTALGASVSARSCHMILLFRGRGYPELAASSLISFYRFLSVQCKEKNLFTTKMVSTSPKKACIYKDRDSLYSPNGDVPGLWKIQAMLTKTTNNYRFWGYYGS